ncbi:MAG: DinB family protein [Anaerolineae bacterium]|nr:DinB family protein [Anaerolineae bacterium]
MDKTNMGVDLVAIDFAPVKSGAMKLFEYSQQFNIDDLRAATNDSVDLLLDIIRDMNDADVVFDPEDPEAHDPYAAEGEEHIGWNMAHLIVHATASSEEWATYSSILARGIVYPAEPRLRYETPWREITTKAGCVQRLEESRRIRLGYLDTWPDKPALDIFRELSPRFVERVGPINATAAFLFGLQHEVGHYDQIRDVQRQALAARELQSGD